MVVKIGEEGPVEGPWPVSTVNPAVLPEQASIESLVVGVCVWVSPTERSHPSFTLGHGILKNMVELQLHIHTREWRLQTDNATIPFTVAPKRKDSSLEEGFNAALWDEYR